MIKVEVSLGELTLGEYNELEPDDLARVIRDTVRREVRKTVVEALDPYRNQINEYLTARLSRLINQALAKADEEITDDDLLGMMVDGDEPDDFI